MVVLEAYQPDRRTPGLGFAESGRYPWVDAVAVVAAAAAAITVADSLARAVPSASAGN